MVAVCPGMTDTHLVRETLNIWEGELKFNANTPAMKPEEVADGVETSVLSGETGSALLVYPGLSFYWPDLSGNVLLGYSLAARINSLVGLLL